MTTTFHILQFLKYFDNWGNHSVLLALFFLHKIKNPPKNLLSNKPLCINSCVQLDGHFFVESGEGKYHYNVTLDDDGNTCTFGDFASNCKKIRISTANIF